MTTASPGTIRILDPTAPSKYQPVEDRARLGDLNGKVVGFLDNSKPNFDKLAKHFGELLAAEHGIADWMLRNKPAPTFGARPELLDELASKCDVVITGSGD